MIVVDASTVVAALLTDGAARRALATQDLYAPHLVDSEVASVLRRRVATGGLTADQGWRALDTLRRLGITRYPVFGLAERIWALRENVTAYDAAYVAVAEALDCGLLTADGRLARAPGLRCPVTVVPN